MPVPKRKTSRSRRDKRSSTKGIRPASVASCLTCQEPVAPHQACKACGYYKGVKILRTKTDRMYERGQRKQADDAQGRAEKALSAPSDDKKDQGSSSSNDE